MPHPVQRLKRASKEVSFLPHERQQIAELSLQLMEENQEMGRLDAIRAAVKSLPENRQIHVRDFYAVERWLKPLWAEIAEKHDMQHDDAAISIPPTKVSDPIVAVATESETQAMPVNSDSQTNVSNISPSTAASDGVNIDLPKPRRGRPPNSVSPAAKNPTDSEKRKRTLIHWRDHERHAIALAYVQQREAFADDSEKESMRKAIASALPADRQRDSFIFAKEREWLDPLVNDARAELERNREQRERERQQRYEAEQKEIAAQREANEAREREAHELELEKLRAMDRAAREAVEGLELGDLFNMLTHRIADLVSARVTAQLLGPLTAAIDRSANAAFEANPFGGFPRGVPASGEGERAPAAPKDHKPRVLVCGVFNEWIADLERDFAATLKLSFFKSAHEGAALEPMLKGHEYDLVVSMDGFTGPDRESLFRKHKIKPLRVTGQVSALKRALRGWLLGEPMRLSA